MTEIENLLDNIDRKKNTTIFTTIDKLLIKKEWNTIKVENFKTYTNDDNFENSSIVSLISRNWFFAMRIFLKQSILVRGRHRASHMSVIWLELKA